MRTAFLVLAGAAIAGCPPHDDLTPLIHVDPRAAGRLGWLAQAGAAGDAVGPHAARVHVMKDGEAIGGPNAVGRPGDLVLENDEVVFVIDQLGSSAGFAESGGNLVDAADARDRRDELGQVFTYFGTFPRQGVYDKVSSGIAADGAAWIEASGHELYEGRVTVTTRYTLRPPDRALLLETSVENTGDVAVDLPSLGDAVQWGGARKIAPGKAPGFKGPSSGPYLGGVGRYTSYALTSTDGAIEGVSGSSWTDTTQRHDVHLAPHQKAEYARVLVVGARPDSSSLVAELTMAAGQATGFLRVAPSAPPAPGTRLLVERGPSTSGALTLAAPFEGMLPAGTYTVRVGDGAPSAPVEVRAGGEAQVALTVPPSAFIDVTCLDADGAPMPCKATFEGRGSTPTPDFGPAFAAGPAGGQATTADGHVSVTLAPGSYRVTASRGPEYALAQTEVTVAPLERQTITLSPRHVVDTTGYLGCDFHQHTMLGTDAPTTTHDRVVSNVAEGLDVAVATEHNVVADLSPLVHRLHLDATLVALAGNELTADANRHPWGHANAWPLPLDPSRPRGGAQPLHEGTAKDAFDALRRSVPGGFVLQINHPRAGLTGYFSQLGFDRARGVGADPGYDPAFDALEVWNGRNVEPRDEVLEDWRALLRSGHPVTPTADTDTHGIVGQEAGYPRTYVHVTDDAHLDAWDATRTADLVQGVKARRDVVLTNGPMLRATVGGVPIGGLAHGRSLTVKVHVECAPWVDVDTVRLIHALEGAPAASRAIKLTPLPSGALGADVVFTATVAADDALAIIASGSRPMSPVLAGDPKEITPWAMTGAVWVDADGDGRSLGR